MRDAVWSIPQGGINKTPTLSSLQYRQGRDGGFLLQLAVISLPGLTTLISTVEEVEGVLHNGNQQSDKHDPDHDKR